jgi:hypothetical protein
LIGEAKFLRALYYFNVVRLWGDAPLITSYQKYVTASDYAIAKSPSTEVYAQIEKDLTEAAAALPTSYSSPDVGRATAGAAKALLAKVYLTKASQPLNLTQNYADAVKKLKKYFRLPMAEQVLMAMTCLKTLQMYFCLLPKTVKNISSQLSLNQMLNYRAITKTLVLS